MADNELAEVGKYVADEYAKEWQRKGSLETRAIALATANVALATLVTAWIDRLDALPLLAHGCARVLMLAAVLLSLVSIGLALVAALAFTYSSPSAAAIRQAVDWTAEGRPGISHALARAYVGQLESARTANDHKFRLLTVALGMLLVASVIAIVTVAVRTWS